MPHRAWILALSFALPVPAAALTPYLVEDIDTSSFVESSFPQGFASLGRRAVFFTRTRELWSSDGTPAGTVRLVAGEPFLSGALATGKRVAYLLTGDTSAEFHLWVTDGTLAGTFPVASEGLGFGATARRGSILAIPGTDRIFFRAAVVGDEGTELWTSDATPAGTHRVADLVVGAGGSEPHELTSFRGRVFFVADDGRGFSLWSTNGTAAGTRLVKDPVPGRRQLEVPRRLTVVGQTLFFFLSSSDGWFLWKSDGTPAGTVRVARLAPATTPGVSDAVGQLGRLFFVVDGGGNARELWVSNGTAAGTRRLARFAAPENGIVFPPQLPGRLLYAAADAAHGTELWSSDGTAAGTRRVADVCPGACSGFNSPRTAFRGRLYFSGKTPASGLEPWSTDGTAAGTRQLKDLCPGACGSFPYPLGTTAGKLFFVARDGTRGDEVWRTNGTAQGTVRLTDFAEPRVDGELYLGAVAGARFLFDGSDGERGRELWATDGTRPGTALVADLAASVPESSSPEFLRAAGSRVVFLAEDGVQGRGLWASDGTAAGTRKIVESAEPVSPFLLSSATSALHLAYFYSGANGIFEVWRSDGTPEGTFVLTPPGIRIETSQPVFTLGDAGYFSAEDPEHGEELWVSDGTPGGTHLVADVDPGPSGSQPDRFGSFLGRIVFEARTPLDLVVFVSDGTEAGTRPFAEAYPFLADARLLDVEIGGEALFLRTDATNRGEIWATDGTPAGTHRVVGSLLRFGDLSASGGWFLFRGGETNEDDGVFLSDGTAAGTRRIAEGLTLRSELVRLQAIGGRFVFTASRPGDFDHPALWTTDGTPAGTRPLIETDSQFAQPRFATLFGDRLLLAGGSRIWSTDGTQEGTSIVLEADALRQAPLPVVAGDRAFFPWFAPETGTELWALRPD